MFAQCTYLLLKAGWGTVVSAEVGFSYKELNLEVVRLSLFICTRYDAFLVALIESESEKKIRSQRVVV